MDDMVLISKSEDATFVKGIIVKKLPDSARPLLEDKKLRRNLQKVLGPSPESHGLSFLDFRN